MQISWLGHSCFKISHDGYSLVIDPYDLVFPGQGIRRVLFKLFVLLKVPIFVFVV